MAFSRQETQTYETELSATLSRVRWRAPTGLRDNRIAGSRLTEISHGSMEARRLTTEKAATVLWTPGAHGGRGRCRGTRMLKFIHSLFILSFLVHYNKYTSTTVIVQQTSVKPHATFAQDEFLALILKVHQERASGCEDAIPSSDREQAIFVVPIVDVHSHKKKKDAKMKRFIFTSAKY